MTEHLPKTSLEPPDERVMHICRVLEQRQVESPDLKVLCADHGLSVFALNRLFKKWLGQTPRNWQRRLRLNEAAILLGRTQQSVLSIAQAVGYESQQSFCRAFFRARGETPSEFRRQFWRTHGEQLAAASGVVVGHRLLPPLTLFSQRFVGNYRQVPEYWHRFGLMAGHAGFEPNFGVFVGVTWDDPDVTPDGHIRYDCAFLPLNGSAAHNASKQSDWTPLAIAGGAYAALAQQGSYFSAVPEGYRALVHDWLPGSGWQLDMRPALEWFDDAPWKMPLEDWRFEIRLPIM